MTQENPTPRAERPCPTCGSAMPVHSGYVTWCDGCDWNINPRTLGDPRGPIETIRRRIGQRTGRRLFESLSRAETLQPRLTAPLLLAYTMSVLVHLVTLALLVVGIVLPLRGWPNPFAVVGGLTALGLVWVLRPDLGSVPESILSRERYPMLYRFVEDIGARLGLPRIHGLTYGSQFNASFSICGIRRRRVIHIGVPLFEILDERGKEALIGHEIAHGVNGDVSRKLVVHAAIDSLQEWYVLIMPSSIFEAPNKIPSILLVPFNLVRAGVAQSIRGYLFLLLTLLYHESQRAEYLADYLGATIAGSEGALGLLNTLHYDSIYNIAVQRAALSREPKSVLAEMRAELALMPQREILRLSRIARAEGSTLDSTHPPTPYRIEFIEGKHLPAGAPVLTLEEREALAAELRRLHPNVNEAAIDRYRRSIHY